MKTCKRCKIEKDTGEYYNQKNYKDGLDPMCTDCRRITTNEYYHKNKEKMVEYGRNWRCNSTIKKDRDE